MVGEEVRPVKQAEVEMDVVQDGAPCPMRGKSSGTLELASSTLNCPSSPIGHSGEVWRDGPWTITKVSRARL